MDMDQAHRMANLYDAAWELVNEGASGDPVSTATRVRFIACWGTNAQGQSTDTLIYWARNFLRHNARPNV